VCHDGRMDPPAAEDELALDPVHGYRVWRLAGDPGALRLAAVTRRTVWPPMEPMRAVCPEHDEAEVPAGDCMCGLYAASSLRTLVRAGVLQHRTVGVVGSVAMWGRVVQHERGVRSSLAYPARVRLVCGPCLSERRGPVTPTRVVRRDGAPVPLCDMHLEPGERGDPAADVESELLGAYAVDALPAEVAVRGLGHHRIAAPVLRRIDAVPTVPRRVRGPAMAAALVAAALVLSSGALRGSFEARQRTSESLPTPVTHVTDEPSSRAILPSAPATGSRPRAQNVMCGVVEGGAIQQVACRAGRADAFGVTSTPPGQRSTCDGEFEWFTRGHGRSTCWFVDPSALRRLDRRAR